MMRLGSYTPCFLKISAVMGTVELTGLLMTLSRAPGHASAHAATRSRTMPALILNKSSRVMPGFLGTPAGMMTRSHPLSAACSSSGPA